MASEQTAMEFPTGRDLSEQELEERAHVELLRGIGDAADRGADKGTCR